MRSLLSFVTFLFLCLETSALGMLSGAKRSFLGVIFRRVALRVSGFLCV